MPVTSNRLYPYPSLDTKPNVPLDLQALAAALDLDVQNLAGAVGAAQALAAAQKERIDHATPSATANTLVLRNATGSFETPRPAGPANVANKAYADEVGTNVLTELTDLTAPAVAAASAMTHDLRDTGRVLRTGSGGQILIREPLSSAEPATRGFVEGAVWATSVGIPSHTSAAAVDVVISLPAGRFTTNPIVNVTGQFNHPDYVAICNVLYATTTEIAIRVRSNQTWSTSEARLNVQVMKG